MDCLNPNTASGGFILVALGVAFVLGALGYRWLMANKRAELQALEQRLSELDDKRRGG